MKLSIDANLIRRFPDYRMITVVGWDMSNSEQDSALEGVLRAAEAEAREAIGETAALAKHPRVAAWRAAFAACEFDPETHPPSIESLLRRVLGGKQIGFINVAVAIANIVSLEHLLPCGGDDLERIEGDFGLKFARGGEPFVPIGQGDPESADVGEVIYADAHKVLCRRWVWRQGEQTRITPDTRIVAINVDALPPVTHDEGMQAAERIAALLKEHCGATTEIVEIGGPNQQVAIPRKTELYLQEKRLAGGEIQRIIDKHGAELTDSDDRAAWSLQDLLLRGTVEDVVVHQDFVQMLAERDRIRIYQGFDPTSPNMHIGHMVALLTLRWFQLKGHEVIFLIGDATAMVGDPSGRSAQREMLTEQQVRQNMATYERQAGKLLAFDDPRNPVAVKRNSDWLADWKLGDVLEVMSRITIQRLLDRDMFQVRLKRDEPLYYVETLYPLLQGADSVAMDVDAELGGRDQLYNMLVGRDLVRDMQNRDKHVLTTPLLMGFDGRKMSKTYGNTVDLDAAPFAVFDGLMKVNDDLVMTYARLLTDWSWTRLADAERAVVKDPIAVKEQLALDITGRLCGADEATKAHAEFTSVRRKGALPTDIETARYTPKPGQTEVPITELLTDCEPSLVKSKGEVRRMIRNKGISWQGEKVTDETVAYPVADIADALVQIGKRRVYRVGVGE